MLLALMLLFTVGAASRKYNQECSNSGFGKTTNGNSASADSSQFVNPFGAPSPPFGSTPIPGFGEKPVRQPNSCFAPSSSSTLLSNKSPFGLSTTTPTFGRFGSTTPAFGRTPFSSSSSSSANSSSIFGPTTPSNSGFGSGMTPNLWNTNSGSSTSPFGVSSANAFTTTSSSSWKISSSVCNGLFGPSQSTTTPSIFGSQGSQGGLGFSTAPAIGSSSSMSGISSSSGSEGSRLARYTITRNFENGQDDKIISISAMQAYKSKSHEELRSEDYGLLCNKGSNSSNQNQGNTLQRPDSLFAPSSSSLLSNQSPFGFSTTSPTFAPSGSSTPPFGANPFSSSTSSTVTSISILGQTTPNNSGFSSSTKPNLWNTSSGSATSPFGVSTADVFPTASSRWTHLSSVGDGLCEPPQSTTNSSIFGSSGFRGTAVGVFNFNTAPANRSSSIFRINPTSSGCGGSKVAPYIATRTSENDSNVTILSISGMQVYENKCHEELRFEDYELVRSQGNQQKALGDTPSSIFKPFSLTPNNVFQPAPTNNSIFTTTNTDVFAPKSQGFFPPNNATTAKTPTTNPFSPVHNTFVSPNNSASTSQSPFPSFPSSSPFAPKPQPFSTPTSTPSSSLPSTFVPNTSTISTGPGTPFYLTPFPVSNIFPSPSNAYVSPFSTISTKPTPVPSTNPFSPPISIVASQSTVIPSTSIINQFPVNCQPPPIFTSSTVSPCQASQDAGDLQVENSLGIIIQQSPRNETIQPSVVVNPFGPRPGVEISIGQPNALTSITCGISGLPVSNNPAPCRKVSLMRIRHVSLRHHKMSAQRNSCESTETKVAFFNDREDRPSPVSPVQPRENPRAWVTNTISGQGLPSSLTKETGKDCPDKTDANCSSFQVNLSSIDDIPIKDDDSPRKVQSQDSERRDSEVLALMPKVGNEEYYTEPSIEELTAKEKAESGFCSRVKEFVVGRRGYGSIKFIGETDVRKLDLESIIQFNNREVIVYPDDRMRPAVGQSLNKPAEVTLLNIKCISKKTGNHYINGPQVQSFQEVLIKKAEDLGVEFVSYDPVRGEWKFRVQHF